MAGRSGIGGQLGLAKETTYNTPVAVTRFLPIQSESLRLEQNYIKTQGLRSLRLVQNSGQHTATTRTVDGGFPVMVQNKGMGLLFDQLNGNANAPTTPAGGTTSRLFTFDIGLTEPAGKSLTIQSGRPDVSGVTRAFTYSGCKVMEAAFSCERGGVLASEWTIDGADESTATALATPTYATGTSEFSFVGASIEFDDVVVLDCIRSASVNVGFPHDTERFCFGTNGVKKEPILNDMLPITTELEVEFSSLTQHTAFRNATRRKIELIFEGPIIEAALKYMVKFTMPVTVTTGQGPVLEGPDVLTQNLTLEALDNTGLAPLTVEYQTIDVAL